MAGYATQRFGLAARSRASAAAGCWAFGVQCGTKLRDYLFSLDSHGLRHARPFFEVRADRRRELCRVHPNRIQPSPGEFLADIGVVKLSGRRRRSAAATSWISVASFLTALLLNCSLNLRLDCGHDVTHIDAEFLHGAPPWL